MWLLMGALAGPAPAAKAPAKTVTTKSGEPSERTDFKNIPTLTTEPGKGYYAIVQTKLYDVLVVANSLTLQLYPKNKGERGTKPIIFDNRFACGPEVNPNDPLAFSAVVNLAPSAVNPAKLEFVAVSAAGVTFWQTWKFSEGKIDVESRLKGFAGDPPQLRLFVKFPKTHEFTPNIEKGDRAKQMEGHSYVVRGGKSVKTLKNKKMSYADKWTELPVIEWVEHQGPWGERKVTLKRKNDRDAIIFDGDWNRPAYEGWEFGLLKIPDGKTKHYDLHGFEIKIE
ncbi:MAG: hypothetical protein NTY53_24135 [Kiritimatiellaeota bacterium]|nr:hypothetical protein [Kiritimatiellota bacterium]